ncbi:hypothetical protein SERLA73DRAFT_190329 [Serpula lacrymans var. lacrymans S7.3]|uniref:Uncharacterized protein n=2 Tax=Serpula lacrymans var. lacrymans TaxID=341189 RepID=F8QFH2_SERL3|nr:uncharacterized protein SERLADRAFT_479357 [Serpula lacrymans var. lacrymans S7.9]EGN92956.1 hypothetical protein SERLA73DRAFT_190329 [Serpula lacrymans var. lacrymans S7.3]EGO19672.1 hypothetical protein SERLADRAFT_479357 [Serpula lacrymans var. lacrymans S7.9]
MHRCLLISEILLNILEHLDRETQIRPLLAMASTCRSFSEPSLDLPIRLGLRRLRCLFCSGTKQIAHFYGLGQVHSQRTKNKRTGMELLR